MRAFTIVLVLPALLLAPIHGLAHAQSLAVVDVGTELDSVSTAPLPVAPPTRTTIANPFAPATTIEHGSLPLIPGPLSAAQYQPGRPVARPATPMVVKLVILGLVLIVPRIVMTHGEG